MQSFEERFGETPFEVKNIANVIATDEGQIFILTRKRQYYRLTSNDQFEYLSFLEDKKIDKFTEDAISYYQDNQLITVDYNGKPLKQVPDVISSLLPIHGKIEQGDYFLI